MPLIEVWQTRNIYFKKLTPHVKYTEKHNFSVMSHDILQACTKSFVMNDIRCLLLLYSVRLQHPEGSHTFSACRVILMFPLSTEL